MNGLTAKQKELLSRIDDSAVRDELAREMLSLSTQKLGLVFERHLPETTDLHSVKPRRGLYARHGDRPRLLHISKVRAGIATCSTQRAADDPIDWKPEVLEVPVAELTTVARFGDTIFPGLQRGEAITGPTTDETKPAHLLLNAENHHALQTLQWSHESKIDLIYIDPPYNTGNKSWIYNDQYVAETDGFKSSKWLSFMERRLELAQSLLKPTGIIIVAIGDDEHHRLRMLMDQVFGARNFISDVVWQGGRKNDARFVSNGADYMLVYSKSAEKLTAASVRWRAEKRGLVEALNQAKHLLDFCNGDERAATVAYRKWIKQFSRADIPPSVARYTKIESETGRLYRDDLDLSWPGGGGPRYDVLHPVTGKPCAVPSRGWIYQDPERLQEEVAAGRIVFGPDETKVPSRLSYLDELTTDVAASVFESPRQRGSKHLENRTEGVFGDKRFPNPKDHEVLARWIQLTAPRDAVVLDFFGGSGSTMEAVLRLNAEDNGTRQCILVTNNELNAKDAARLTKQGLGPGDDEFDSLGVYRHVTVPRIRTVVTGQREDGSTYSDGLPGRVETAALTYLDPDRVRMNLAFKQVSALLWLRAGGSGRIIDTVSEAGWDTTDQYAIAHSTESVDELVEHLADSVTTCFIVTNSAGAYQHAVAKLPEHVEPVHLYERYLTTFALQISA